MLSSLPRWPKIRASTVNSEQIWPCYVFCTLSAAMSRPGPSWGGPHGEPKRGGSAKQTSLWEQVLGSSPGGHGRVRHGGDPTESQNEAVLQSKRASGSRFWGAHRVATAESVMGWASQGPKMFKINTETSHLEPLPGPGAAKGRKCSKPVQKPAICSHFLGLGQPSAENAENQY